MKNFQNETDLHLKETRSRLYYINSTALTNNWAQAEQHRKNTAVWHFIPRVTDVRYDELYVFVFQSKKKPVKTSLTILFYTGPPKIPDWFKIKNVHVMNKICRFYSWPQIFKATLFLLIEYITSPRCPPPISTQVYNLFLTRCSITLQIIELGICNYFIPYAVSSTILPFYKF